MAVRCSGGELEDGALEGFVEFGDPPDRPLGLVAGLSRELQGGGGFAAPPPPFVEDEIAGDVDQVGAQLGLGAPAGRRPVEPDEDLHGQLFGRRLRTDLAPEVTDEPGMVPVHEQTQGVVVTGGDQTHQALVVFVVGEQRLFLGHLSGTPGRSRSYASRGRRAKARSVRSRNCSKAASTW